MIEKWTPDLLTLPTTFYDVSVLCNRFSKTEMRQFGASTIHGLSDFRLFNVTSSVFHLIFFSLFFLAFLKTESNCEVCFTETIFFLRDARNASDIVETPDILTITDRLTSFYLLKVQHM